MKKLKNQKTINSLYIHIPFCRNICFYCDFPKLLKNPDLEKKYLIALIKELKSQKINHKLKTIYIGGGTPSSVNLLPLFKELSKYLDKDTEFTVEANVLDINIDLLKQYKNYGVNRISLGVQSLNNDLLIVLGRKHCRLDVLNKIKLTKRYIKNINVDLIYGYKELSLEKLKKEIKDYLNLNVNHISTYSLEIHKCTKFYNDKRKDLDTSIVREQFDLIYSSLTNHGYNRYEISNFAKEGYESKHNITYWKDNEYYGIGLGAASYKNKVRYKNTLNIFNYLSGKYQMEKEKISLEDDKKYYLMLNLRLSDGIKLKEYKKRFNIDLLDEKREAINKLIKRKLLLIKNDYLLTTYEGSMLLDIILEELF